jgi:hypothetical protein
MTLTIASRLQQLRMALLVGAALAAVVGGSACAVCAEDTDCPFGQVCLEDGGGCIEAPKLSLQVLTPRSGDVVDGWSLTIEVGFSGDSALIEVERALDDPGDPCIPFGTVRRVVTGSDEFANHIVTIPGMPALGPAFSMVVRADVGSDSVFARTSVSGPPVDESFSGITIEEPRGGDVDVVFDPLIPVVVSGLGLRDITVFVEPSSEASSETSASTVAGDSTPRQLLLDGRGEVPALRGPHTVWAEATVGSGATEQVRRCGRAMQGGPNDIDDDELEIYLLTTSRTDGDVHLVELSTRVVTEAGQAICDGRSSQSVVPCVARVTPNAPAPRGRDSLQVALTDGVVEIAAVPRIISGPVDAMVRLSRGSTHIGFLGPVTLQPASGEVWLAGRVVIDDDAVVAVVPSSSPPSPGLPW